MTATIRQADLEAYLDESLPGEEMARIEKALRKDQRLVEQVAAIQARRNAGVHTLGGIWRTARLSCPSREQLGSYLLEVIPEEAAEYVRFHVSAVGCRYCQANLADLQTHQAEQHTSVQKRRRKYFQSSVGHLGHDR